MYQVYYNIKAYRANLDHVVILTYPEVMLYRVQKIPSHLARVHLTWRLMGSSRL